MKPPAAAPLPNATGAAAARSHRRVPIQIRFNDVDLLGHVNETDMEDLLRTVKKEFAADGMTVSKVSVNAIGELETDARYEDD